MFRALEINTSTSVITRLAEPPVRRPHAGAVLWLDLQEPTSDELEQLRTGFGFHPLAIEDCGQYDTRPKLEEYEDHLFVVIQGFAFDGADPANTVKRELHAFLGERFLVTVHAEPTIHLETIWRRAEKDPNAMRRGPDFLYYLLADSMVDGDYVLLDKLAECIDEVEEQILSPDQRVMRGTEEGPKRRRGGARGPLSRVVALRRTFVDMRRTLSPQRDVFALLSKREHPCVADKNSVYFRDVYDQLARISETIDAGRDLLGNALDAYISLAAQRTNDVVKSLTILSAIFLPLTFMTGFFGQNFEHIPYGSHTLLILVISACVLVPAAMFGFIWWRRWF